jgi:hypothetical protein
VITVREPARTYWQGTPAGQVYREFGIPEQRDLDSIDADVEMINDVYRRRFRRDLTDAEERAVRAGAEMRGGLTYATHREMGLQELHDRLGYRITVPDYQVDGRGIAVMIDGEWTGDPAVAAEARAAEAQREMRAAYMEQAQEPVRGVPHV